MESRVEDRSPQKQPVDNLPDSQDRWGNVLQKVVNEQSDDPWYVKLGISLVWSVGIALAVGLIATLILAVRALLSANVQFDFRSLSDHIFWAAALLMVGGMVSPSAADVDRSQDKRKTQERRSPEERRSQALERRVRRVYDPWRWRIWGGAAFTFALAMLSGLLAAPAS